MIGKVARILKKVTVLLFDARRGNMFEIVTDSIFRYSKGGIKEVTRGINNDYRVLIANQKTIYSDWIKTNELDLIYVDDDMIPFRPLISIVMATYNTPEKWLKSAIESVLSQSYSNWELCIADDCSTDKRTIELLRQYEQKHDAIKVSYREINQNVSVASSSALGLANGQYVAFLDHDDELATNALYEVVKELNVNPNAKLIYSDEDKIDEKGRRFDPHFKSDWNPDMFFSQNYISHLTVIKKSIIDRTKGFRVGYEGSQDYDLLLQSLRFMERDEIYHISKILYHWRAIEGSTAKNSNSKSYTTDAGMKALRDFFKDNEGVEVNSGLLANTYKVDYGKKLELNEPLVSIVIATKDKVDYLKRCIDSIINKTSYTNYEIVVISNGSKEQETFDYFKSIQERVKIIEYNIPFNYSKINNYAARFCNGDILALINNDIEVINSGWLKELVQHAVRDEIGVVGAKLYYPDNTIQHGGVVLGIGEIAGHSHKYYKREAHGYFSRLQIIQNYSAVTGACLVVEKRLFEEVNGLDEENLPVAYNDVDFCLRLKEKGYYNLWTPYAELYHHESISRGKEDTKEKHKRFQKERLFMKTRWGKALEEDEYYNPNLTRKFENFGIGD